MKEKENHEKIMESCRKRDELQIVLKYASDCLFRIKQTRADSMWLEIAAEINDDILSMEKKIQEKHERDEEREAWYEMHSSFERSRDEVEKLIRERDEARAALMELWQSADAFLPNFDAETIARWRKAAGWEGEE
jgi:hypothetical protein